MHDLPEGTSVHGKMRLRHAFSRLGERAIERRGTREINRGPRPHAISEHAQRALPREENEGLSAVAWRGDSNDGERAKFDSAPRDRRGRTCGVGIRSRGDRSNLAEE